MKTIRDMIRDADEAGNRFWHIYMIVLGLLIAYGVADRQGGWFAAFIAVVVAAGVFVALMNAYVLGKISAYRETTDALNEARDVLLQRREMFVDVLQKLDAVSQRFQGPS